MATYGVAEAKNNFTHLLDRVQNGEKITITRHGKPIAEMNPPPKRTLEERRAAQAYFTRLREAQKPLPMSVVELLHMDDEPER